jgi:peptidoglycan/LPS O-acetylase OafA/YrhL
MEVITHKAVREEERVLGLDLLRAIAIMWVVIAHAEAIVRPFFPKFPSVWILDAVDLFFVLSGFLIGRIILRDIVDRKHENSFRALRHFWVRRWLRTLPAYYAALAACIVLSALYPMLAPGFDWRYFVFLQNMWTVQPWFMSNTWSLSIEEYFYLIFPLVTVLLLPFFGARRRRAFLTASVLLIIGTAIVRVGLAHLFENVRDTIDMDGWCRKFLPARIDAIAFGTLGAILSIARPAAWKRATIPAALLGVAIFYLRYFIPHPYYVGWLIGSLYIPVCTLLFLPLFTRLRTAPRWIAGPIRHISKYSYSMYLVHHPLVLLPIVFIIKPHGPRSSLFWYAAYFVLVMLASYILHFAAERPGLKWRAKLSKRWHERMAHPL